MLKDVPRHNFKCQFFIDCDPAFYAFERLTFLSENGKSGSRNEHGIIVDNDGDYPRVIGTWERIAGLTSDYSCDLKTYKKRPKTTRPAIDVNAATCNGCGESLPYAMNAAGHVKTRQPHRCPAST